MIDHDLIDDLISGSKSPTWTSCRHLQRWLLEYSVTPYS